MSVNDLRARPVHHTCDAIEAHPTVVMAALAVARYLPGHYRDQHQASSAPSNLQEVTINLNGSPHRRTYSTDTANDILTALSTPNPGTMESGLSVSHRLEKQPREPPRRSCPDLSRMTSRLLSHRLPEGP